jgi:hypothetical protein
MEDQKTRSGLSHFPFGQFSVSFARENLGDSFRSAGALAMRCREGTAEPQVYWICGPNGRSKPHPGRRVSCAISNPFGINLLTPSFSNSGDQSYTRQLNRGL